MLAGSSFTLGITARTQEITDACRSDYNTLLLTIIAIRPMHYENELLSNINDTRIVIARNDVGELRKDRKMRIMNIVASRMDSHDLNLGSPGGEDLQQVPYLIHRLKEWTSGNSGTKDTPASGIELSQEWIDKFELDSNDTAFARANIKFWRLLIQQRSVRVEDLAVF